MSEVKKQKFQLEVEMESYGSSTWTEVEVDRAFSNGAVEDFKLLSVKELK